MTIREIIARALFDRYDGGDGVPEFYLVDADSAIAAIEQAGFAIVPVEPTEAMVRATVTVTDVSREQYDIAAASIEGMPALPPEKQKQGISVAAALVADWQAMIAAAKTEAVSLSPSHAVIVEKEGK